jgi:Family of unknown function (DUF5670)
VSVRTWCVSPGLCGVSSLVVRVSPGPCGVDSLVVRVAGALLYRFTGGAVLSRERGPQDSARCPIASGYALAVLWVIVGILLLLWFLGLVLRAFGGLIHILIVVALIIVIYRLLTGRRLF